ncbi:MAG: hypothetical protein GEV28_38975 [Actinophytocola sp.]|uniref:hypothetical protein n=1 Tax=Actinophytocola sp. TaxID=1872138 RepID=UPI00132368B8|nr:hypothetical protein [Actinophytocola sp.]MPZ86036.1 hypothetical protein [Actinophytocola sp.]
MRFSVSGSNVTHLVLGSTEFELSFDAEALKRMVELGTEALAEMDQRYAREEAERDEVEAMAPTSSR